MLIQKAILFSVTSKLRETVIKYMYMILNKSSLPLPLSDDINFVFQIENSNFSIPYPSDGRSL